tara:strand:+ start:97 stop:585 length:489 start_codon:yes stop_codon:yes gene_type:complete
MTNKPDIRDIVYYGTEVTKDSIKEQSLALLKDLDEGHIAPLQLAAQLKLVEDVISNVKEELRQRVVAEKDKYGKDDMTYHGAKFDIREAGVKYDYSQCDDMQWNELSQQIDALTEQRKERESFLKALKEKLTYVDESTGEIATIYPPQKKSTTTYAITWSKK